MVLVLTEKPDLALKLSLALDYIKLSNGKIFKHEDLKDNAIKKLIEQEQEKNLYLTANYKGSEYKFIWAKGHLLELKRAEDYDMKYRSWDINLYPMIPDEFDFKVKENMKSHYEFINKELNNEKYDYIINACDPDREGEAIFQNIYKKTNCKLPYKRLWTVSLTRESIRYAFENLKDKEGMLNLSASANARAIADWTVGINMTVVCTEVYSKDTKQVLSIGRCQTPVLAAIVERDKKIDNFKKEKIYKIYCTVKNSEGVKLHLKYRQSFKNENDAIKKSHELLNKTVTLTKVKTLIREEKPPLMYNLSTLEVEASNKYALTPLQTDIAAEKLYLKGIITYPRTDSRYLTFDMKQYVQEVIKVLPERYDDIKNKIIEKKIDLHNDRVFDNDKVLGHYAIIPTNVKQSMDMLKELSVDEQKVYGLVVRNFLKSFMSNAKYETAYIEGLIQNTPEILYINSSTLLDPGFKYADKYSKYEEEEKAKNKIDDLIELDIKIVEKLKPSEEFVITKVEIKESETSPPKHFNDATLINLMENAGKLVTDKKLKELYKNQKLGTPATRSKIIDRLIKVGYIKRINNRDLVATNIGHQVIDKIKLQDIKTANITVDWEYKLSLIENGQYESLQFLEEIKEYTIKQCNVIKEDYGKTIISSLGECPDCRGVVVKNKYGYYNCTNVLNKTCQFKLPSEFHGKPITDDIVRNLLQYGKTNKLKGFKRKEKKGNGKDTYSARLILQKIDGSTKLRLSFTSDVSEKAVNANEKE